MVRHPVRTSRSVCLALLSATFPIACGLLPAPAPPAPFPGDGVAGFGDASPIQLCLGTASVVSPQASTGAGAVCVTQGGHGAPCSNDAASDASCDGIERCICGRCIVEACQGGAACAAGQVCNGGRCTLGCTTDGDCPGDETCNTGGCGRPCSSDAACYYGERCDQLFNVCVAQLCDAATPCGPGNACEAVETTGALHEPEVVTLGGAAVAFVEIRNAGVPSAIYRATIGAAGLWTADPPAPVLNGAMGASAGAPSVLVDGDQVDMYFALGDGSAIAHAVSTDGGRTFAQDAAPVLVPAAAWENGWVGSPSVVLFQGETLLFYEGGPAAGVGLARVSGGVATRAGSGPILTPATLEDPLFWRDVTQVGAPYAVVAGDVLRVYFTGRGVDGSDAIVAGTAVPADPTDSIGLLASLDGVTFAPYPAGPVFARVINLREYLGEREAAVQMLPGGGATIVFVSTDSTGTIEDGLAQAGP
jgi:hypothetical protein